MKRYLWLAALAFLAACGSGDSVEMENASVSEVAREMGKANDAVFVNPGQWEQTATLLEVDAPGIPEQYREAMKKQMGQSQVHRTCLTPEQTKNPREDFFTGADKNCRYEHFKWGGGKIDMKLLCTHEQATQTMEMSGTYEPDTYQMAMSVASKGGSPMESMTMKMKVDAKRVGECNASQG
ncbi:MAG TPA: DUF3617 domain-containing protein [Sphingomicrobium sp.]|nr:DUF3617 domain-containing protein [Sphingomicrobium sp.]